MWWIGPGLLVGAILAVFGRVVWFDFVKWDDDINITANPLLTAPWSWELAGRMFESDQALRFKPLHWLLDRVVFEAFGFNPLAWHALNLVQHLGAAVLLFRILQQVLKIVGAPNAVDGWAALIGAALWALHPLRAEPVAWATASTYPFTAVWLLGSYSCYLKAIAAGGGGRWLVLAWVMAVAAYASYPVGLGYAFFLLVSDEWMRAVRGGGAAAAEIGTPRARWLRCAAFLLPAVLAAGFTLWTRYAAPGIFVPAPAVDEVSVGTRGAMALASMAYLAGRFVWPVDLSPNVPPLTLSGSTLALVFGLALVAATILVVLWRGRAKRPGLAFVGFGFVALSLPCVGLTERPTWPVDRYSYLVHLPLVGGLAGLMAILGRDARRQTGMAVLAAVALTGGVMAALQAGIWRDSAALFSHFERGPRFADDPRQQAHVYALWASHEGEAGRPARAAELFDRANAVFHAAMRTAVARADYEEALRLSADFSRYFQVTPVLRRERGAWLLRLSRWADARAELRQAEAAMPGDPRVAELLREANAAGKRE